MHLNRSIVLLLLLCAPAPGCEEGDETPVDADSGTDIDVYGDSDVTADSSPDSPDAPDAEDFDSPDDAAPSEDIFEDPSPADGPQEDPAMDTPADEDEDEEGPPPLRDDAIGPWAWHEQAPYAINSYYLPAAFADAGYAPPAGVELVVARVVDGMGQPAYQFYDLSGAAFSFDFWPASTIKVLACLGALDFMGTHGLSGDAVITIHYPESGDYRNSVWEIYDAALRVSSNTAYDRCVEIAGFDRFNEAFLSPGRDLPTTVIQRRYGYSGSLRVSPEMDFIEGDASAAIPRREGTGDFGCPPEGNCANLFEMINALRRVLLHHEIPEIEQFNLQPQDAARLADAMLGANSYFQNGAEAVLGMSIRIFNKTGYVPGDDILDHGFVVNDETGERFLVAVSVPETTCDRTDLSELVRRGLAALTAADAGEAMPWQYDAGIGMIVQLDDEGVVEGHRRIRFSIDAPGADSVRLWTDTWPLGTAEGPGPRFSFTYDYSGGGERLLVLQAMASGEPVGYRAMAVNIPPP